MIGHGILVADKPSGPTSHDVVSAARKLFATRAVGHAGTLDPMASGVLLLLFGEATKLSNYLTLDDKSYLAEITLGSSTNTLDAEGEVTQRATPVPLAPGALDTVLKAERARREQVPPAVSAIKLGGVAAHRRARRGEAITLDPRPVRVHELELVAMDFPRLQLKLRVSKGYYVRSLARDIGDALEVPAHLSRLRRTASGVFTVDESTSWPPADRPELIPVSEAARRALPSATLTAVGVARARCGQPLAETDFSKEPALAHRTARELDRPVAWLDESDELVALGEARDDAYRVVRGFSVR